MSLPILLSDAQIQRVEVDLREYPHQHLFHLSHLGLYKELYGPIVNASNSSAFVPSIGVTIRGALTICKGSRSVTALIVPKEEAKGKRAIATWASPLGTFPM